MDVLPVNSMSSDRLPRCCTTHTDWSDLAKCLLADYAPPLDDRTVLAEVQRAHAAVSEMIPLSGTDQLEAAELIIRNRLEMTSGRRPDSARLDPESHERSMGPRTSSATALSA